MDADDLSSLVVSLDDLEQHIVKYGMDVFPPFDFRTETTRAHELFRELQTNWPEFFQELSFRPESNQFQIVAAYGFPQGTAKLAALTFMPRGPVFAFPFKFGPFGECEHKNDPEEVFLKALAVIKRTVPGLQVLRLGLIRELVFATGGTPSAPYVTSRYGTFPGAEAKGGETVVSFRDDFCNIRVKIGTIEIRQEARHPTTKQVMAKDVRHGLAVNFDVSNVEMRPQADTEIERTIERANSLWPRDLLEFLNWRKGPE